MVEATAGFRLDPTSIYWMYTKCIGSLRRRCEWECGSTLILLGLCRCGVDFGVLGVDLSLSDVVMFMVAATRGFRLDPTSILDVYKVFGPLDVLFRGTWVHPYTIRPVQVGDGFWVYRGRPHAVMSWLMLKPPVECNQHDQYDMFTMCYGQSHGYGHCYGYSHFYSHGYSYVLSPLQLHPQRCLWPRPRPQRLVRPQSRLLRSRLRSWLRLRLWLMKA
jgi:hypothetical protein